MLQEPASVRFLHVAMLQHDPEGRIAFMHRTAEGKFFPNRCRPQALQASPGCLPADHFCALRLTPQMRCPLELECTVVCPVTLHAMLRYPARCCMTAQLLSGQPASP